MQLCGGGYVLDLQLPGGPPYVVLLGLLMLLANLRERSTLLTPTDSGSAKVLLRLPVQVSQACASVDESLLLLDPFVTASLSAAQASSCCLTASVSFRCAVQLGGGG